MASDAAFTRFVMVETSHAGNVGAAARAMKVMGFDELVLVAPRKPEVLEMAETVARASGAVDVLEHAHVVGSLDEALADAQAVVATVMTPRDFGPPTATPRDSLPTLAAGGGRVAFVFGSERFGLSNAHVRRAHLALSIPTAPAYGSLNLAQAVQLVAYEWRLALGGFVVRDARAPARAASAAQLDGLLVHWKDTLEAIGFLDPAHPKRLMARLAALLRRATPTAAEVDILRGIARAAAARHDREGRPPTREKP